MCGKLNKRRISVDTSYCSVRIPAGKRLGQRAGTTAYFKNASVFANTKGILKSFFIGIRKSERAGMIQCTDILDLTKWYSC